MTDITELAQSLKSAAESVKNYGSEWFEAGHQVCTVHKSKINLISLANPANILTLVEALEKSDSRLHEVAVACATAEQALEKAQSELAKANGVLDKIKSTSCHVDTSDSSFIPNSLDAWGRPVPQHLPYDFSGNPGASATQYCNGWNDAGGYWLNYVRELESSHAKLRDAMAAIHNTIRAGGAYTPLAAILNAAKRAHEESAGAAGIKMEVE